MHVRYRQALSAITPEWLGWVIYRTICFWSQLLAKMISPESRVWPRNSVVLGPVQFSISDIDLTVIAADDASIDSLCSCRRWFFLTREINWYRQNSVSLCLRWINPIELRRDPKLMQWSTFARERAERVTHEDQLVFLLRKFESCQQQFIDRKDWQPGKWKSYCRIAGLEHDLRDSEAFYQLVDELGQLCGLSTPITGVLKSFLSMIEKQQPPHEFLKSYAGDTDLLVCLFPHRFCFVNPPEKVLVPGIIVGQIHWEFWGLETQRVGAYNPNQLAHLERLNSWLAKVSHTEHETDAGILRPDGNPDERSTQLNSAEIVEISRL